MKRQFGGKVNKSQLINAILDKLRDDLALYHKAAGAARAEATDEQSKAENKYDTRGLEASYLARGQSRQAAELAVAIEKFQQLPARDFTRADPIDTGALVDLQNGKETNSYFLGPRAGGTEISFEGREILVITPESPLGSQLLGRRSGEKCLLEVGGQKQQIKIARVI
jgi:transcription elongation GreA/GreB family factor